MSRYNSLPLTEPTVKEERRSVGVVETNCFMALPLSLDPVPIASFCHSLATVYFADIPSFRAILFLSSRTLLPSVDPFTRNKAHSGYSSLFILPSHLPFFPFTVMTFSFIFSSPPLQSCTNVKAVSCFHSYLWDITSCRYVFHAV